MHLSDSELLSDDGCGGEYLATFFLQSSQILSSGIIDGNSSHIFFDVALLPNEVAGCVEGIAANIFPPRMSHG